MTALTHSDLTDAVGLGGRGARKPTWWAARTPPAGGRASCGPTSRWTPKTCCCGSSSASCEPTSCRGRPLDPFATARRRHVGQLRAAAPATCRPPSRPTPRCASPATTPTRRTCAAARAFILASGGIEASRVFTRIWLAMFGEWSWDDLPAMPPELVLLPKWLPLNVYDWGCWARQTVVADHRGRAPCARRARCRSRSTELRVGARRPRRPRPARWRRRSRCSTGR